MRQGCPLSLTLFQYSAKTLARQEKEMKGIQIGKEEVKSLLSVDDILYTYIRNTKHSTINFLEIVNNSAK